MIELQTKNIFLPIPLGMDSSKRLATIENAIGLFPLDMAHRAEALIPGTFSKADPSRIHCPFVKAPHSGKEARTLYMIKQTSHFIVSLL